MGLFVTAPVLVCLFSMMKISDDLTAPMALFLPIPFALILGIRLAMRVKAHSALVFLLGMFFIVGIYFLLCILSVYGCAMGGGGMNFH